VGIPLVTPGGQNDVSAYDAAVNGCNDPIAPGGVAGDLALWFKADNNGGVTTDGNTIGTWVNSALGGENATGSSTPTYEADLASSMNFNPIVRFNSSDMFTLSTPPDYETSVIFAIGAPTATGSAQNIKSFWRSESDVFGLDDTDADWALAAQNGNVGYFERWPDNVLRDPGLDWADEEQAMFSVRIESDGDPIIFSKNGGADATAIATNVTFNTGNGTVNNKYSHLGNQYPGGARPFGDIAESIVYDANDMSDTDLQKIESYLALKYGISLDQTTPYSYLASDSTVVWDASTAGAYVNDIAGIGMDSLSCLHQRVSKSVNDTALVAIALDNNFLVANTDTTTRSDHAADLSFMTWANNGGDLFFTPTGAPLARLMMDRTRTRATPWCSMAPSGNCPVLRLE